MSNNFWAPLKAWPAQATQAVTSQWPTTWKQAIPNILTLIRLFSAPLIFALLWSQQAPFAWAVLVLFTISAITDFLDGFLSRLWKTESWIGRVMDPIADKLLVASVLVGLIAFGTPSLWITVVVYVLLMREFLVAGLREASRDESTMAVSILGKAKTMLQMVALFVLLAENAAGWSLNIGYIILTASAVLSVASFVQYLMRMLREQQLQQKAKAFSQSS